MVEKPKVEKEFTITLKPVTEIPASAKASSTVYIDTLNSFLAGKQNAVQLQFEGKSPATVLTAMKKIVSDKKMKVKVIKRLDAVYLEKE